MSSTSKFMDFRNGGVARNIIILLFLFGIIPLAFLYIIFFSFYFDGQVKGIGNVQEETAEKISLGISAYLERMSGQIQLFARILDLQILNRKELKYMADFLLDQGLEYETITVVNLEGKEICKVSRYYTFSTDELGNFAFNKSFRSALLRQTNISQIEVSKFSKFPQVRITVPIIDRKDKVRGVLDVGVNVAKMWELISKSRIGESRYAYVVDSQGLLIAFKEVSSVLQKRDLRTIRGVQNFLDGTIGAIKYKGLDNELVIGANAIIPLTGWGVVVEQHVKSAYRNLYVLSASFLGIFIVIITSAIMLGFRFSFSKIVEPIRRFQKEARIIAKGDFNHIIEISRSDELGQLAESFNSMVNDLQKTTVSRDRLIKEIEEKRRTERALRESEDTLKSIFRAAPTGIGMVCDRVITQANYRLCEMVGYSRDELLGQSARMLYLSDEDYEFVGREKYAQIGDFGTGTVETHWRRKDGGLIDVLLSSTPLDSNNLSIGVTFTALDITERKRSEEELKFTQFAIDHFSDAAFWMEPDAHFIYVNEAAARILGYNKDELLTMTLSDIDPEFPLDAWADHWAEIKRRGSSVLESHYRTKDGRTFPVEIMVNYLQFGGKEYNCAFVRDVSQRKRDEEKREELEARLQRAQKMEAIGTLAGGVAHDLNNILSGIVSYPDLLLMQLPQDNPLRKPITIIQQSGIRAAAIVQDLLTLARRGVTIGEVVNLNDIISEYLESPECEKLLSLQPGVNIETNLETDLMNIIGSSVHLSKTMMNLVSNAAEAMPEGGTVHIDSKSRYVDTQIRGYDEVKEGDYVVLTVSDTGVGISKSDKERIFEPFYTKKQMGRSGTGLGMAVVWGTVKDLKGYIDIDSIEGKGTTFSIYFPVTRKELKREKRPVSIDAHRGQGESILVVDDVVEQREIASSLLSELGYSVATASNGEEAIKFLENNAIDLLVLDMIMEPGLDGLDTYRRVLEFHPTQRAIIASGFSETERVKEAQKLGAGQYIKKPYTLEKIAIAVRAELDK